MVFDHQKVRIIGLTQPVVPEISSSEEMLAYCARVSNPKNQLNHATAPKLLSYLIREKHFSPFEMVSITAEITTTRDIARQILRHRSFSFQEFSQRYAEAIGFVYRQTRLQDTKNRQNSILTEDETLKQWFDESQRIVIEVVDELYTEALQKGIAKEQARALLPEGLTISKMYMAGTLRSWLHYIAVRIANGTQKENSDIAFKAWNEISVYFPSVKDDEIIRALEIYAEEIKNLS